MRRKESIGPNHKYNSRRAIGKQKRGFGKLAMEELNLDVNKQTDCDLWAQRHDPLFHIKGKERHRFLSLKRR